MLSFEITGTGKNLADIEHAVGEAMRRIEQGNMTGLDHNESSRFHFIVEGEEEEDAE